jgi:hypothetical protein
MRVRLRVVLLHLANRVETVFLFTPAAFEPDPNFAVRRWGGARHR